MKGTDVAKVNCTYSKWIESRGPSFVIVRVRAARKRTVVTLVTDVSTT